MGTLVNQLNLQQQHSSGMRKLNEKKKHQNDNTNTDVQQTQKKHIKHKFYTNS
jgi:hypothetical protein